MISVYIHIPFCKNICKYCDFCKMYENDVWINKYLYALEREIRKYYAFDKVKTLYFGGGTPSCLSIAQLEKLFEITKVFDLDEDAEITFECNVEDLTIEKLKFLKNKVNRLSIGVQTFDTQTLEELGRKKININKIINAKKYFKNINIDLMYGFQKGTLKNLKSDLKLFLELDLPHLSAYNLILEPHTMFHIENYKIKEDLRFDKLIEETLTKHGYKHYEISNYAKEGYESKHNLTYWNNEKYYGFGLGASGYLYDARYDNTRSLNKYLIGEFRSNRYVLDENERIQNEFILGLRKIDGINKEEFRNKYKRNIKDIKHIKTLLRKKQLLENEDNIYINPDYIYVSNEILVNFLDDLL